jgi:hypothetical protein
MGHLGGVDRSVLGGSGDIDHVRYLLVGIGVVSIGVVSIGAASAVRGQATGLHGGPFGTHIEASRCGGHAGRPLYSGAACRS